MLSTSQRFLFLFLLPFATLFSCKHDGWQTSPTGLKYWVLVDSAGDNLKEGDFATLHVKYTDSNDSIIFSTYNSGQPVTSQVVKSPFKGSFEEAITLFSPGDSGSFMLSVDSITRGMPDEQIPAFLKKGTYITCTVKILKSQSQEEFQKTQMEAMQKAETERKARAEKQIVVDEEIIKTYISQKKLSPKKTEKGVYIQVMKQGNGIAPQKGDTVEVHYTGRTLDGKVFDSSRKEDNGQGQPFDFVLGVTPIIEGWQDGIAQLKQGSRATLIIPSSLAYGEQSTPRFGPNSVLTFDVELVNVKKAKK